MTAAQLGLHEDSFFVWPKRVHFNVSAFHAELIKRV
ncbi:MAG: hypothetical protein OJF50_001685 [Nitrospira sp.]|jgi:hypothetical protein|nr:hypothetical protein [Nitrospira sp.]